MGGRGGACGVSPRHGGRGEALLPLSSPPAQWGAPLALLLLLLPLTPRMRPCCRSCCRGRRGRGARSPLSPPQPLAPRVRRPRPRCSLLSRQHRERSACGCSPSLPQPLSLPLPLLPTIHPSSSGMCTQKGVRRYREGDWGVTPQTRSPRSLKRRTRSSLFGVTAPRGRRCGGFARSPSCPAAICPHHVFLTAACAPGPPRSLAHGAGAQWRSRSEGLAGWLLSISGAVGGRWGATPSSQRRGLRTPDSDPHIAITRGAGRRGRGPLCAPLHGPPTLP
jgi:hypothetical protein